MLLFFPLFSLMFFSVLVYFRLVDFITLITLVLLRPLGGVSFVCFLITLFYPLSLCDKKRGSNFYLDRDCIFNRSSDFCPRMAKGGVC
jgi:hypothetical protein